MREILTTPACIKTDADLHYQPLKDYVHFTMMTPSDLSDVAFLVFLKS